VVWGARIFLHVADGDDLNLWCVDRSTGLPLWKKRLSGGNEMARKENMSSPSPVTDGRGVWVLTGTGILKAFDNDGNEQWTRNLPKDYGEFGLNWNYASSPLLYEDMLIVQVVHGMKTKAASYVLGLDKTTGETRWRVERPDIATGEGKDAYTTPAVARVGGSSGADEIIVTGAVAITGHDPATGRELWRAHGLNDDRTVASPVAFGDRIFAPSRQRPLLALKAGGSGDVTGTHVVWTFNKGPDVPTPITDGTWLYLLTDNGVLYCLDAMTGKEAYHQRLKSGTYSASPVLAGGRLYVTNEDGVTVVWKPGPTFELLAENDLEEFTLSSPAISDGQIFIRTETFLYAIGRVSQDEPERETVEDRKLRINF
jgi:outer membrane protein assembly factor BamB